MAGDELRFPVPECGGSMLRGRKIEIVDILVLVEALDAAVENVAQGLR
ncbi:hypothetical protein ACFQY9_07895 [Microvirga aerilata]